MKWKLKTAFLITMVSRKEVVIEDDIGKIVVSRKKGLLKTTLNKLVKLMPLKNTSTNKSFYSFYFKKQKCLKKKKKRLNKKEVLKFLKNVNA